MRGKHIDMTDKLPYGPEEAARDDGLFAFHVWEGSAVVISLSQRKLPAEIA